MQRTVIPPRRWVPIDLWFMANRSQRDARLGDPSSIAEVERLADLRRASSAPRSVGVKAATLFHGGPAGLEVGDLIRPAVSLGLEHSRSAHQPHYNPHRVYVTQRRDYAAFFATHHSGLIYEVVPIGRLLVDQDARGSFHCSAAQVVAIHPPTLETGAVTDQITRILKGARSI